MIIVNRYIFRQFRQITTQQRAILEKIHNENQRYSHPSRNKKKNKGRIKGAELPLQYSSNFNSNGGIMVPIGVLGTSLAITLGGIYNGDK